MWDLTHPYLHPTEFMRMRKRMCGFVRVAYSGSHASINAPEDVKAIVITDNEHGERKFNMRR